MAGTFAGILGDLVKLAVNLVLYIIGVAGTTSLHIAAAALLPARVAQGPPFLMLGLVVEMLVAAGLGILGAYLVRATGRDFLWLKGIVYGGIIWVIGYGLLAPLLAPRWLVLPNLATSMAMLAAHLAYGLTTLFIVGRYALRAARVQ